MVLILSMICTSVSYGLWRYNSEVRFTLTISQPEVDYGCCICGKYTTVQEGLDLLSNVQYPKLYSRMDAFEKQLYARAEEINNMPPGSITYDELEAELEQYEEVILGFGNCITIYGDCIENLNKFYSNLPNEEQKEIQNFWVELSKRWTLHSQLWTKRSQLYTAWSAVRTAGLSKVNLKKDEDKELAGQQDWTTITGQD